MANLRTTKKKTKSLARKYIYQANASFMVGVVISPEERIRQAKTLFLKMEGMCRKLEVLDEVSLLDELQNAMIKLDDRAANFAAVHHVSWGTS